VGVFNCRKGFPWLRASNDPEVNRHIARLGARRCCTGCSVRDRAGIGESRIQSPTREGSEPGFQWAGRAQQFPTKGAAGAVVPYHTLKEIDSLGRHYTILREDMDAFLDRKPGEWHK
jgi:hypothetical protein